MSPILVHLVQHRWDSDLHSAKYRAATTTVFIIKRIVARIETAVFITEMTVVRTKRIVSIIKTTVIGTETVVFITAMTVVRIKRIVSVIKTTVVGTKKLTNDLNVEVCDATKVS